MKQTNLHKDLVLRARQWLLVTNRCNPVFTERGSQRITEFPDAIGWDSKDCIVVECKASLEDFRADKKKAHRQNGEALGSQRFFLVSPDLKEIVAKELPDGWGLIVATEHGTIERITRTFEVKKHDRNYKAEMFYLRSRVLEIQRFGR